MGLYRWLGRGGVAPCHGRVGLLLLVVGESLILVRLRPLSDIYFPFVWLGYILLLDAAVYRQTGSSPYMSARRLWLALFPVSSVFWWFFELLNQFVHNWIYIGADNYTLTAHIVIASVDFSTVLPAVWTTALFVDALLPPGWARGTGREAVPAWLLPALFGLGILFLVLPVELPRFAFGLVWGCMALALDPINHRMGRPSMIAFLWRGAWRVPVSFALAALMCGFFWEAWNYWSMPKWIYAIPYVGFWHVFEMPLLGWSGYLPFGIELFVMANFVLPFLHQPPLTLTVPEAGPDARQHAARLPAS